MKNMQKSETYIMILLLTMSLVAVAPIINSENTPIVSMDGVNISKGGNGQGLLMVVDVSNLGSCDVALSWDPDVVTVTDVGNSDFDQMFPYLNNTAGVLSMNAYSNAVMNGDFTIAKITFEPASGASAGDECDLEITDSLLLTADPVPSKILHDEQNGTVHIKSSSDDDDNSGGGGGGSAPPPGPANNPPVANASKSQSSGFVGESIQFDGSFSNDIDGTIDNYTWDFYDGEIGYEKTTEHIFLDSGIYQVTLTVTDNEGTTDKDTFDIVISKANNPPSEPILDGPKTGHTNTTYAYTAVSTDVDNDTIQYTFNWNDFTTNTTNFLLNGTITTQTHSWTAPGIYEISVKAYDNETESSAIKLTVLIDTHWIKDIGYFINDDGDGTYDSFYSNATKEQTDVEKQNDGTYLMDNDGDGDWDYIYNIETGTLAESNPEETSENNAIWYALGIGFLLAILVLIVLFLIINMGKKVKKSKNKTKK